jgi:predicted ATP-dependent serine protease
VWEAALHLNTLLATAEEVKAHEYMNTNFASLHFVYKIILHNCQITKILMKETAMDHELPKSSSGISGLDAVLKGGFPSDRISLIHGGTGTGKTIIGIQFLISFCSKYKEYKI